MKTLEVNRLSAGQKILSVIAGAFITGFIWRIRGEHDFGAMWGMFSVGVVLTLLIFALYGKRRKINYEMIPVCVLLMGVTTGGWGTLLPQMSGYLRSDAFFTGEETFRMLEINPFSGLAIMLLLGFGWMPLFSICLGTLFSERKYDYKDFLKFIGVYYIVLIVCNFTVSHFLLSVINPQAMEGATTGLLDRGYNMSPMMAFLKNLGSDSWAEDIPFCRNYFTSIKVISSATATVFAVLFVRISLKDKITSKIAILVNAVCALSITIPDVSMILDSDRGFMAGVKAPIYIQMNSWHLWEYFTGFFIGLGIMLIIVSLPDRITADEENYEYTPLFKSKKTTCIFNSLLTLTFCMVATYARAFGIRVTEVFVDEDIIETLVAVLIIVVAFVIIFKTVKRNIFEKGINTPLNMSLQEFSKKALTIYVSAIAVIYYFCHSAETRLIFDFTYKTAFQKETVIRFWELGLYIEPILMLVSLIIFFSILPVCTKKKVK